MNSYISLSELRRKLRLFGVNLNDQEFSHIDDELLEEYINYVELELEAWLGYSMKPQEYVEEQNSNSSGFISLHNYPVLEIHKIYLITIGNTSVVNIPRQFSQVSAIWEGGSIISAGANNRYRIEYLAGYLEIPKIVKNVFAELIASIIKEGSVDIIRETYTETTSLSLPGGLSEGYKPLTGQIPKERYTMLDKAFEPLKKYKRIKLSVTGD